MPADSSLAPAFAGPLYRQVAAMLRVKICSSEWTPRAPLPNEVALAREAGVSIGTMRKALELLEDEHLIERRQGRGTFIVETSAETEIARFSNLVIAGRKAKAEAVKWSVEAALASDEEAKSLRLARGAKVYRLEGLWRSGRHLSVLEKITVSEARFPDLPKRVCDAGQFLFPIYRRYYNELVSRVVESVSSTGCGEAAARKLGVESGTAGLVSRRVAYGPNGAIVEIALRTIVLGEASYVVTMD